MNGWLGPGRLKTPRLRQPSRFTASGRPLSSSRQWREEQQTKKEEKKHDGHHNGVARAPG
jgi:hypothetical protein